MKKIKHLIFILFASIFLFAINGCITTGEPVAVKDAFEQIFEEFSSQEVTDDLVFPTEIGEVKLTFYSNNRLVIENNGEVVRPLEDTEVTITVRLTYNNSSYYKEFTVLVLKEESDPLKQMQEINIALLLALSFRGETITEDITLPTTSLYGSTLTWTSSHPEIVSAEGKLSIPEYSTSVTLSYVLHHRGTTYAPSDIVVFVKGNIDLTITLNKTSLTLAEQATETLTATLSDDTLNVVWSSSDSSVATVDENGNVVALKEGSTTITASIEGTSIATNCTLTVLNITFELNASNLIVGLNETFALEFVTNIPNPVVTYQSSNDAICTVEGNNIKGISEGETIITVTIEGYPQLKKEVPILVFDSEVIFTEESVEALINVDKDLTEYVEMGNNDYSWIVDNEQIASLEEGILKPLKMGKVVVTVISNLDEDAAAKIEVYIFADASAYNYYTGKVQYTTSVLVKSSIRSLITSTHRRVTSYDDCKTMLQRADVDPDNSSNIILFYARVSVKGTWDSGNTWNREHVWPRSQGWFTTSGAGSDLHHIRPTNGSINTSRGNKAYGECPNGTPLYYKPTNKVAGHYSGSHFEPNDEVKGDVARIVFYLLARYSQSDSYPITNVASSYEMLLKWHQLDPVDQLEIDRNTYIYSIQGNRNPFIDMPDYAYEIWG